MVINFFNKLRQKKLFKAIINQDILRTKSILDRDIDLNCRNTADYTPMLIAAEIGNLEIFKLLYQYKKTVCKNKKDLLSYDLTISKRTPLMLAVINNRKSVVEFILRNKMQKNEISRNRMTALDYAINTKNKTLVDLLTLHRAKTYSKLTGKKRKNVHFKPSNDIDKNSIGYCNVCGQMWSKFSAKKWESNDDHSIMITYRCPLCYDGNYNRGILEDQNGNTLVDHKNY